MALADIGLFFRDMTSDQSLLAFTIFLAVLLISLLLLFFIKVRRLKRSEIRLSSKEDIMPLEFSEDSGSKRSAERRIILEIDRLLQKEDEVISKEKELEAREKQINSQITRLHDQASDIRRGLFAKGESKLKDEKPKEKEGRKVAIDELKEVAESQEMDDDTRRVLNICDDLLGDLPDDVVDKFTKSKDFALYKKVLERAR